mmetsp:Transcript_2758/g.8597  ORF Transcript_2758/g.8597 Transcript_2758/m.8597 type:complete len:541 (+) Transcript_2758:489-2111(+)
MPEAGAHDERGWREHLLHARPALRPLVPNHDHRPLERLRVLHHRSHHLFLCVEAARRPAEPDPLLAGDLPHGALGRKVPLQNGDVPRRLDRLRDGIDYLLPLRQRRKVGDVLGDGLAGDSHAVAMQQALLQHVLEHGGRASNGVQVLHHVLSTRLEVRQEGRLRRDPAKVVQREVDAGSTRHRDEVDGRVCRPARHHHQPDGVLEGLLRHDVARFEADGDAVLQRLHRPPHLGHLLRVQPALAPVGSRVPGRDRGRVRDRHAQRLDRRRHCVGRVHSAARARSGASVPHDVEPSFVVDLLRHKLAVRLEGRDDVELLVLVWPAARADGASVDHHRGPVDSRHRHDAAGHVLVAAWDREVRIVELRAHHRLDAICDQVSRLEGVCHAVGAVGDAVGDADRVEAQAHHPAPLAALLGGAGDVEQVHVARVALVPHRGDADLHLVHAARHLAHVGGVQLRLPRSLRPSLRDHGRVLVWPIKPVLCIRQHRLVRAAGRTRRGWVSAVREGGEAASRPRARSRGEPRRPPHRRAKHVASKQIAPG